MLDSVQMVKRRRFIKTVATLSAISYSRVLGANDRIHVGIIGVGFRGGPLWNAFLEQPDTDPAAVCDVYEPHLEKGLSLSGNRAQPYRDFRRLLEHRPLDVVIVATPDHWHAIQTINACAAGLDVYVEKPLSHTIEEGRRMVATARKYNRVVQTGSQQRSGPHYKEVVDLVQAGELGPVHQIEAGMQRNSMPGFGTPPDSTPPSNLNFDMWLGPAPRVTYNPLRVLYNFRWFWDYSGGQTTNFGAHSLDVARWALRSVGPVSVAGFGRRYAIADNGETPDVQEIIYDFPDAVVNWSVREMNGTRNSFLEFHGTKATLSVSRLGYTITGESWQRKDKKAADFELLDTSMPLTLTPLHVRNFLDCVKSRQRPNADVEEGHLTATMCHLGNIATRLGRSLQWDATAQQIVGDPQANAWLTKPYRYPWTLDEYRSRRIAARSRSRSIGR